MTSNEIRTREVPLRLVCAVIALILLGTAWLVWGFDSTPSLWVLILLLTSAGVFSNLRP